MVVLVEVDMAMNNVREQLKGKDIELKGLEKVVAEQALELDALKVKSLRWKR